MVAASLGHETHVDVYAARHRADLGHPANVYAAETIKPLAPDEVWLEHVRDEIGETTRVPTGEAW